MAGENRGVVDQNDLPLLCCGHAGSPGAEIIEVRLGRKSGYCWSKVLKQELPFYVHYCSCPPYLSFSTQVEIMVLQDDGTTPSPTATPTTANTPAPVMATGDSYVEVCQNYFGITRFTPLYR